MQSLVSRRTLLIGAIVTAGLPIVPTFGRSSEKAAFMKKAIEEIELTNRLIQQQQELAPEELPVVKPFGDWDYYYLLDRLKWLPNEGQSFHAVTVPGGFVTDLASIPRAFWSVLPKTGRYAYAAIVHDYLYWVQDVPRSDADEILKTVMINSHVRALTIQTIYHAVRLFGQSAWDQNSKLKKSGEKRFLKEFPPNALVSWDEWRKDSGHFTD